VAELVDAIQDTVIREYVLCKSATVKLTHTGSNPVLTTKKLKVMKDIVINYIYPICAMMITIGIWVIAIELERIRKN
jgi:hypothetical protein